MTENGKTVRHGRDKISNKTLFCSTTAVTRLGMHIRVKRVNQAALVRKHWPTGAHVAMEKKKIRKYILI